MKADKPSWVGLGEEGSIDFDLVVTPEQAVLGRLRMRGEWVVCGVCGKRGVLIGKPTDWEVCHHCRRLMGRA